MNRKLKITMCSAETLARQNCASILLHRQAAQSAALNTAASGRGGGDFKCKSCDRAFKTFQALGGHQVSHKELRLTGESGDAINQSQGGGLKAKRKRVEEEDDYDHDEKILKKQKIQRIPILSKSKMSERVGLNFDLNFPPC